MQGSNSERSHYEATSPAAIVASFTKEINPRLANRPLIFNGRLANRGLTSLVKEATVCCPARSSHATDILSPKDSSKGGTGVALYNWQLFWHEEV